MTYITIPTQTAGSEFDYDDMNQILEAIKDGTITIKTESIEVSDDGYIKLEDVYISAGSDSQGRFATHAYFSDGAWVFPGATPGMIMQIENDNDFYLYGHDGAGTFTQKFGYDDGRDALVTKGNMEISKKLNVTNNETTISSGAITVSGAYMILDTEGSASTDDLDTINGGTVGDILIIQSATNTRDIVVKHNTGNILLDSSADKSLTTQNDKLMLIYTTNNYWHQISFSNNA